MRNYTLETVLIHDNDKKMNSLVVKQLTLKVVAYKEEKTEATARFSISFPN